MAQLANQLALALDREGVAEMSCIAGVGGGVPTLVRKARRANKIIALDGCVLHCVKQCLARHQVQPTQHYTLTEFGLKKRQHTDFDPDDMQRLKKVIIERLEK